MMVITTTTSTLMQQNDELIMATMGTVKKIKTKPIKGMQVFFFVFPC